MTPAQAALLRGQARLVQRLKQIEIEAGLDAGDDEAWHSYCECAAALAAIAPLSMPEARGALLTTAELAERLRLSPKTILRKAKRGELHPQRFGRRGGGALRWSPTEAAR